MQNTEKTVAELTGVSSLYSLDEIVLKGDFLMVFFSESNQFVSFITNNRFGNRASIDYGELRVQRYNRDGRPYKIKKVGSLEKITFRNVHVYYGELDDDGKLIVNPERGIPEVKQEDISLHRTSIGGVYRITGPTLAERIAGEIARYRAETSNQPH